MPDGASPQVPLSAFLSGWLQGQRTQVRPATLTNYEETVRRYVIPNLGDVPLADVHVRDLNRLYAHLFTAGGAKGQPLARATVEGVHCLLRKALDDAVDAGLLRKNPARHATLPRLDHTERRRPDVWTIPELHAFLEAVGGHRLRDFWIISAFTGMRSSELLALGWADVDWEHRLLRVHRRLSVHRGRAELLRPKGKRGRSLHIDAFTVEALRREQRRQRRHRDAAGTQWSNRWGLVFTNAEGRHLTPAAVSNAFRTAADRAPVPRIRLYDLRHFHATVMLAAGVPVKVVSARLGHASAQTTLDVYAHVLPAMDADAAQRFSRYVEEADGPTWR